MVLRAIDNSADAAACRHLRRGIMQDLANICANHSVWYAMVTT